MEWNGHCTSTRRNSILLYSRSFSSISYVRITITNGICMTSCNSLYFIFPISLKPLSFFIFTLIAWFFSFIVLLQRIFQSVVFCSSRSRSFGKNWPNLAMKSFSHVSVTDSITPHCLYSEHSDTGLVYDMQIRDLSSCCPCCRNRTTKVMLWKVRLSNRYGLATFLCFTISWLLIVSS